MRRSVRELLLASTLCASTALVFAAPAHAQDPVEAKPALQPQTLDEVVVTGSRIRRQGIETSAPVNVVSAQDLDDRGYVQVGQALNNITANVPSIAQATSVNGPAGNGQTFPNLFNLGPGRTLTLVDGRRFVSSATPVTSAVSGSGSAVDTNLIPVGLLDRVDVVEAGGAAVYGSDAIAGVINYVLKRNFTGLELDLQGGETDKGDHAEYNARITAGTNFAGGRGNIAADFEYSKSDPLVSSDRGISALSRAALGNVEVRDARFWEFNNNGVIFTTPAPVPVCGGANCFARVAGVPQQFSADGQSVIGYNPGVNPINGSSALTPPFATGGEGYSLSDLSALFSGVERYVGNVVGHYDLTDHLKISGSLLVAHTTADDPAGSQGYSRTILNTPASGFGYIAFTKANPFLTASQIATLSAASTTFANGGPLFLSKNFADILPTREFDTDTDTVRGLLALDGDFTKWNRDFYYSASFSHAYTDSTQKGYDVLTANFNNAISVTKNAAGQIVCSINATTVTVPGCAPINPFGNTAQSAGAIAYSTTLVGYNYFNQEDDFLLTLGGDVVTLPAGKAKFSAAYEHRYESADYNPSPAPQAGLVGSGVPVVPTSGDYSPNEYSAELLVPIVGGDFTLPGVHRLEVSGQYRRVENSIAGGENIWGAGIRWELFDGLTLRASRSRNFRAPTLYQLNAPSSTALAGGILDPCDSRAINAGTSPAVRAANCLALFNANPLYGTGSAGGAAVGASAATRLATFQDTAYNFSTALVTSGGNAALQNELSDTFTYGFVFQPKFVPGRLTIVLDHIDVDLLNGITGFTPTNFVQSCYDVQGASGATCSFFTRDGVGNIATAVSTTYNAASIRYKGETLNVNYRFPVQWIVRREGFGNLELEVEATHNDLLRTNVQGAITQVVGTVAEPRWVARADLRWQVGPLRLTYEAYYLPSAYNVAGANPSNNAYPYINSNLRQDISALYSFGKHYELRAGVTNITDTETSYPTFTYGDILGRRFFVGIKARY